MKTKSIRNIKTVCVLVIVGIVIGFYVYRDSTAATVSVTGNSQMTVAPDRLIVYLLIQTQDESAVVAKNENAEIYDDVLNALLGVGVEMNDIETENYNIYPQYNWSSGRQDIIGYTVSNNIKIKIEDFDNADKVVDASVDNGALVSYINFELSNEKSNEYKALVLANASQDAKAKATAIATSLGKELGRIVSITSSEYNYYPYPVYKMGEAESSDVREVATNIQPENLVVSATVIVVYKIN